MCVLLVRGFNVLTVILFPEHIDSRVKGRIIVIYISVEFVYVVQTIEESQKVLILKIKINAVEQDLSDTILISLNKTPTINSCLYILIQI